jgi:exopolysaccharide/PEP-CTERM locus tyrosine autokinase
LPGDGKTFNCINLALSMATERDKSVVLVDADVAKPHISSLFGLEKEPGLIDLLTDSSRDPKEFLLRTNVPGLRLLPAGRHDEHATELLASRRMAAVVESLSKTFPDRLVIFDSPPLMVTSEARVLASAMGQIVLVIRSGVTPQKSLIASLDSLDHDKAISIVLNQASRGFGSDSYGGYGYGGYGYGAGLREH